MKPGILGALEYIRENEFSSPAFPRQAGLADAWGSRVTGLAVPRIHIFPFHVGSDAVTLVPRWQMKNIRLMTTFSFVSPRFLLWFRDVYPGPLCLVPAHYYCFLHFWKITGFQCKQDEDTIQTDRHGRKREGNGSQYNERKPWVLSHTQTVMSRVCHLICSFSPFLTNWQSITAGKPCRFAPSFCPSFTPAKAELNTTAVALPATKNKKNNRHVVPKVIFPMSLSMCEYLFFSSMLPNFSTVCGFQRVRACVYLRQGHPSQTVPSACNSLVYLSLDQRAAAAVHR